MIARALAIALLALTPATALAQDAPRLASFPTDENRDVFVAIYGDAGVELAGCPTGEAARAMLQLPADAPIEESTQAELATGFGFGTHPAIPCPGQPFDRDWQASVPIWADIEGSGNYFLPALSGGGYVQVPTRCTAIKTALAIRERLQLPGVLKGATAPPDAPAGGLILGCGTDSGTAPPVVTPIANAPGQWSLHKADILLSAESTIDTIYVARYLPPGDGATPSYLPILRIDGRDTPEIILGGGPEMLAVETALAGLFGISAEEPIARLGAAAVTPVRNGLLADLCITACDGYVHRHEAFLRLDDFDLSPLPPLVAETRMDRLGRERLSVAFVAGRQVAFTGCPAITSALGFDATAATDWLTATATALGVEPGAGSGFDCRGASLGTCVRRAPASGMLLPSLFVPGPDCGGKLALRIELPATAELGAALDFKPPGFTEVALVPATGVARSRLRIAPTLLSSSSSSCVLSPTNVLIAARDLPRLELSRIDLERRVAPAATGSEVVALQVSKGALVLDDVSIGGGEGDERAPVQRGINLCLAELYGSKVRIMAETIAVQGLSAKAMLSGAPDARSALNLARYGLLMSAASQIRLDQVDINAGTPVTLLGATLEGSGVALGQGGIGIPLSGLQLERGANAHLTISTIRGFRCAASFADGGSSATIALPGNDIAGENTHEACGPGRFSLIE